MGIFEKRTWNYFLSKDGGIITNMKGKKLSTFISIKGYISISLIDDQRHAKTFELQVLVGRILHKDLESKIFDHIDRDPFNNHPDNIRGVTDEESSSNRKSNVPIDQIDTKTLKITNTFLTISRASKVAGCSANTLTKLARKSLKESEYNNSYWQLAKKDVLPLKE